MKNILITLAALLIGPLGAEASDPSPADSGIGADLATSELSLAGTWRFQLDARNEGKDARWFGRALADSIKLPGTTDEAHKGDPNPKREIKHFTRVYPFNGAAWYQRDIDIPVSWNGKRITLELERTKTTIVWLDDREVGSQNSLTAPHVYDLGHVTPGRHILTLRVSNQEKPPVGDPHQLSDHTQTDWNGIVGRIALKATASVWLDDVQIAPDLAQKQARVRVVFGPGNVPVEGAIRVSAKSWNSATVHESAPAVIPVKLDNDDVMAFTYDIGPGMQTWDEFSPALYQLTLDFTGQAGGKRVADHRVLNFGMREFKTRGTQFVVNGRPTFLRGKHDACVFPLTGYAPMSVEEWVLVLKIAKSYGINTYRCHTWCPPDAAFAAADIVGIYIQPELPNWGPIGAPAERDAKDVELKSDSESIKERTKYLIAEGHRILNQFGNHPSFVMLALGNENNGSREVMGSMVADFRVYDRARRLLAQGSNNRLNFPTLAPGDDFWTTVLTGGDYKAGVFQPNTKGKLVRGSTPVHTTGHINNDPPSTRHDYCEGIAGIPVPVIGHEIGQFQVFPDFKEIPKFTGVVQARSFEVFRERLDQAGMLDQADDFVRASGALAVRCYREDIEAALRTPGFGGFHLLDLQDFPGQGTALVGILDSFMDSKGLITPEAWREFCSETVPLLRFDRYTWTTDQTFEAEAQVANYGPSSFTGIRPQWILSDAAGKPLARGTLPATDIPAGKVSSTGRIVIPLQNVPAPQKLTLEFTLPGTRYRNHYPLWVYPSKLAPVVPPAVSVVRKLDESARAALAAGGRVVLLPEAAALKQSLDGAFITDFWCYPMFKKYNPPGTLGILIDPKHPVFANFPTDFHGDWQWWRLTKNGRPMILDALPKSFRPLVQVIDNFERNHRLGLLWEAQIGSGKLLVCSSDILGQQDQPEVRQFYQSLLDYAASPAFQPKTLIPFGELEDILQGNSP